MGNGRIYDKKHFRREQWTGWLMLLLFIGLPLVYILMIEFGLV
ncbi:MAG: hypothetical protein ACI8UD_000939 [Planctomycetota bacterium]|jgi:hypothetical protein